MRIHLIAVGGSIMHNLALALQKAGHEVSGSDDEIYDPAYGRLADAGLLPDEMGWHPERLDASIELVILGMHARPDNPELKAAQLHGLKIQSFPEYIYQVSQNKKRVVVAGSHGKTTTTSMILHVLQHCGRDFDFLVGAQLEGFDHMVKLTEAPLIVLEGDEYLSSPIDRVPKIWHYHPHIAIITGIAWDHMNVFPTFAEYKHAFAGLLDRMEPDSVVFYDQEDQILTELIGSNPGQYAPQAYLAMPAEIDGGVTKLLRSGDNIPLHIFGNHNLKNLCAAYRVLRALKVSDAEFDAAISSFRGAAKRQQLLGEREDMVAYLDFAHAPSKVRATVDALAQQYPGRTLVACLELHTYSSLNKAFLPHYFEALKAANVAAIYLSEHTMKMKKRPPISDKEARDFFGDESLVVLRRPEQLLEFMRSQPDSNCNFLLMSSGTFDGTDLSDLVAELL